MAAVGKMDIQYGSGDSQAMIKTHGHVPCGQVRVHETLCVIYMNQPLAVFSHL